MRIIFGAYRQWGINVMHYIARHPKVTELRHVSSIEELERVVRETAYTNPYDMVLLCGWSWQVSEYCLKTLPVISEHPCEKDEYSLGTPLQGQISDGIRYTKHRIVKIGYPELIDRQYAHEVDMNLSGNMEDILSECESTAKTIYTRFLDDYPNITWKTWPLAAEWKTPKKPKDSKIERDDLTTLSTKKLYDKMRMLEHPYPNAFIEDEEGTLYFERVKFKAK